MNWATQFRPIECTALDRVISQGLFFFSPHSWRRGFTRHGFRGFPL